MYICTAKYAKKISAISAAKSGLDVVATMAQVSMACLGMQVKIWKFPRGHQNQDSTDTGRIVGILALRGRA